jgi:hypothetical protein
MNILANKKSHSDYPVTNTQWKIIDANLREYLDTLQLVDSFNTTRQFAGINTFYLRERYDNYGGFITHDPWNRQFVVMPLDKRTHTSVYQYYSYGSINLNLNVDVIVTTVNRSRVFCVDLIM